MALKRQRIFQERKNALEMFDNEHLIKRLHFISYSNRKQTKNIYITKDIITDFSLAQVFSLKNSEAV